MRSIDAILRQPQSKTVGRKSPVGSGSQERMIGGLRVCGHSGQACKVLCKARHTWNKSHSVLSIDQIICVCIYFHQTKPTTRRLFLQLFHSVMSNLAAARVIKNFRLKQLLRVESHIRQLGPLSDHTIPALEPGSKTAVLPNPFIPRKTLTSKKWKPPVYSLRQQVELVKKAKAAGLLHLLPPGPKNPIPSTDVKEAIKGIQETPNSMSLGALKHQLKDNKKDKSLWMNPVAWEGRISTRKVRGRELGITLYAGKKRMFKGHKWERARRLKMKKRQMVLKSMERRIHNFKSVSWMFLSHASDFDFFFP